MQLVLLVNRGLSGYLIFNRFIKTYPEFISEIILFPTIPESKNKGKLVKNIKSSSFWYLYFNVLTITLFNLLSSLRGKSLEKTAQKAGIRFSRFKTIDKKLLEHLANLNPHYIINGSGNIMNKAILSIPTYGILNYHCARLPEYRGAANYFWMLIENSSEGRGTLHYVDTGLDTGAVIAYSPPVPIQDGSSVYALWRDIRLLGFPVLESVLPYLEKDEKIPATNQDESRAVYRSFPKPADVHLLFKKGFRIIKIKEFFQLIVLAIR
jgi:methionyl-tRNA formyltransferase